MKRIPSNSHRIHLIWLPAIFFCSIEKSLRGTRFNSRKEGNGKIEDGSDGYTDNRIPTIEFPEMFRELDQALA